MNSVLKRTVREHAEALRRGEYSAAELCREYIKRIKECDDKIGAFLLIDEESAFSAAKLADERLKKEGETAPILCGIPCAVKDNIMTRGMKTTCGSKILENYIPPYDAFAVEKLKDAGAVILGKTNMDEFAMGSSTENSAYKKTANPLFPERVPGGSSGGSAAAVAAFEVPFSLGSDTGGSVRQPASFCGLYGISPTYGRVSRFGLASMTSSLDRVGVLSHTVFDNAAVLSCIAGHDKRDMTSLPFPTEDYTAALSEKGERVKIGLVREMMAGVSEKTEKAILNAFDTFRRMGYEVCEVSAPSFRYAFADYKVICCAEVASNMGRYDGIRYGKSAGDYTETRSSLFGDEVKTRILMGSFVLSAENYEKYYEKARSVRRMITDDMNKVLEECDIMLSPAVSDVAFPFGEAPMSDGLYRGDEYCMPQSLAGLPSLCIPCGTGDEGLPIGALLSGKALSEGVLYRIAAEFERGQ